MSQDPVQHRLIHALHRSIELASFYEPGDRLIGAIADPLADALNAVNPGAPVFVEVDGEGLQCRGALIAGEEAAQIVVRWMALGVTSVTFEPYLSREDLWTYLVLLGVPPGEIHDAGGFEHCLNRFGCVGLEVNVVRAPDPESMLEPEEFSDPPWTQRIERRVPTRVFDPDSEPT